MERHSCFTSWRASPAITSLSHTHSLSPYITLYLFLSHIPAHTHSHSLAHRVWSTERHSFSGSWRASPSNTSLSQSSKELAPATPPLQTRDHSVETVSDECTPFFSNKILPTPPSPGTRKSVLPAPSLYKPLTTANMANVRQSRPWLPGKSP